MEPPGFPEMIDQAARGKEQWFVCRQCSSAVNWQTGNGVVLVESSALSKFHWLDRSEPRGEGNWGQVGPVCH